MTKKTETASKTSITLFTTNKDIDAAIKSLHTDGQALQAHMHKTACSVLAHLGKNRDVRYVLKCVAAMPDMSRKNSLMQWFETFGQIVFGKGETAGTAMFATDKKHRIGDAMDKPFWKFKANEGMPYEAIDFTKYVEQQIKKLDKDIKEVPAMGTDDPRVILLAAMKGYNKPGVIAPDMH